VTVIGKDLHRYAPRTHRSGILGALRIVRRNYGLQALIAYRLGRWLLESRASWPLWPVAWPAYFVASRCARVVFDIRLGLSAHIGPGLYIGHFGGIKVRGCRIGEFCSIAQSVEISCADGETGPTVGDRVWIGAHAKILGRCLVGSGSTISAGSVVTRDVPPGALCMGNPARIAEKVYDNRKLLSLRGEPS
jgi:serine O-acetyltransferase